MKKNIINRRNFIGTGLAAAASVTVGKALASEKEMSNIPFKKNDEHPFNPVTYSAMPTRSLGKTGYKVGILSLGGQETLEIAGREEESEKNHSPRHRFGNQLYRYGCILWKRSQSIEYWPRDENTP